MIAVQKKLTIAVSIIDLYLNLYESKITFAIVIEINLPAIDKYDFIYRFEAL